ncbi:MAG: transposase [Akkermansiaceae bacterium]|nr:transposase [Akkermansiaceae bacterium]
MVDRRFVLGGDEREKFRVFMRMQENFTGCRVLAYCLMSNHFHILLEVPPMPEDELADDVFFGRLRAIYSEAFVAEVAREMREAREAGREDLVAEIRGRYTYRMNDLSEFMKTLLQRFTRWFNRTHERRGTLWEERFKSVIVESGFAARTIAAYIDLNPVRAGMVTDPAAYRWSSYGEAVGGGSKGWGKKAREGLVRACLSDRGAGFEPGKWSEVSRIHRRLMGIALGRRRGLAEVDKQVSRSGLNAAESLAENDNQALPDLGISAMLRCRVRYFTDGAVIGSRDFVNEAFAGARERFPARRRDGARRMRGTGAAAAGVLWSMRDLRTDIG